MCSDDNYVYLIGGTEGDICKNDCYQYNPNDNTWSTLASMNSERSQAGIVYFNEKIYVFGGSTLNRCLSSCEILTLSTNQWKNGPTMKESRRGCGAVLYHNKIFIIGGSNGITSLTSIEIFNPITNEWLININGNSNQLNIPRIGLGVTVCCDKIYVIGGFDGRTFLKSIEIYDENTQQWRLTFNELEKNTQIKTEEII
jgi:N-acetylneuraminic acid mutarotase